MSSASSPISGMRDTPFSRNSAIPSATVCPVSSVIMSVRGTITSRTMVSLNSKIEWISSRSSTSSTSRSVASSTIDSSCSSLEKAALRGRPGVTRLPSTTRASAIGPVSTRMARTSGAVATISARGWARPTLRGLEPTSTNETPIMISALTPSTSHHASRMLANASVTSTAAIVSATMRRKLSAFTCAPMSLEIVSSRCGLLRSAASSTRSLRLSTPRAASIAAKRPPSTTSTKAVAKKTTVRIIASAFAFGQREPDEHVALDAEHFAFLGGLGVVETEQVQQAVRRQQQQFVHR